MSSQVNLIEKSLELIKPNSVEFSAQFYDRLFAENPQIKPLFRNVDIETQQKKLIMSLVLIAENLRSPVALDRALKSLGARHVEVGTLKEYYPMVGNALIETFKSHLGQNWTAEMEEAWITAYNVISQLMLEGAKHPEEYLNGELTFYEWLDLYGEYNPQLSQLMESFTKFKYGKTEKNE